MHLQWLDVFIKFTCTCLTISLWWWNKSKMVCVWKRINNLYWIIFQSHISYAILLGCITEFILDFFSITYFLCNSFRLYNRILFCFYVFLFVTVSSTQRNLFILIHLYVLFRFCFCFAFQFLLLFCS